MGETFETSITSDFQSQRPDTEENKKSNHPAVPVGVPIDERDKPGNDREKDLLEICIKKFGMVEVDYNHQKEAQKTGGKFYISRVSEEDDLYGKQGDFVIWFGNEELHVDLTTNQDSQVIKKKYDAEANGGPRVLEIPAWAIKQAVLGGRKGLDVVRRNMETTFSRYIDDRRLQKAESSI